MRMSGSLGKISTACLVVGSVCVLAGCLTLGFITVNTIVTDPCAGGCNAIGFPIAFMVFGLSILLGMTTILVGWSLTSPTRESSLMKKAAIAVAVFYVLMFGALMWLLLVIVVPIVWTLYRKMFSDAKAISPRSRLTRYRSLLLAPMLVCLTLTVVAVAYPSGIGFLYAGYHVATLSALLVGLDRLARTPGAVSTVAPQVPVADG